MKKEEKEKLKNRMQVRDKRRGAGESGKKWKRNNSLNGPGHMNHMREKFT